LILPALEHCLKCSHLFNILDSSGSVGVTERTAYILRVRQLAIRIAKAYMEQQTASSDEAGGVAPSVSKGL
jgi:glycyl-tRNA synthetase alpha chain